MCTSFGEKAKTKSKNVSLRSNTELSKELLELDSIILVTNDNTRPEKIRSFTFARK